VPQTSEPTSEPISEPASPSTAPSRPGWLFWLAFAAALAARLAWLDVRPLHHDEGVNAWFLRDLLEGRGYRYNPEAFHGPFLYLFGWLPGRLLGVGTAALRLPVAVTSASMILLLLPLRRRLGAAGITGTAWLLALSPSLIFYGRDLIHETYLAFFSLALVAAASLWIETRRRRDLLLAAACAALLFTVKETAVLALAGLAAAALVAEWPALRSGDWKAWLPPRRDLALAAALFAAVWIVLFTTFFTNPVGIIDSFRAFLPWLQKGAQGSGHEKPWTYFPGLLLGFEAPTVVCSLAGAALAVRRRDRFGLFCAAWAAGQLALYSAIPYKTPWLMINIVLPGALTAGVLFRELARTPAAVRYAVAALFAIGLGGCVRRAADAAVRRYDDPALGLVYSDTSRDVWNLLAFLRAAAARDRDPGGVTLVSYLSSRWPLPWYLRDLPHTRWQAKVEGEPSEAILLADRGQDAALGRLVLHRGYRRREFFLRPGVPVEVWVRGDLWPTPLPQPSRRNAGR
jgi:uncharacterized protein (TIGR03663 family)